ncbi:MAG TPA: hypothetical protein VF905_04205 [Nitrospirota bacterium]
MNTGNFSSVPTAAIEDALKSFVAEQAIVLNDRLGLMIRFGEYKAQTPRPGIVSAIVEKGDMDALQIRLHRLTLLISTCRAILFLTTSMNARAELHFPSLRMKIPYAAALALSLVGADETQIDTEGTMTLAAFTEFYGYIEGWKVVN